MEEEEGEEECGGGGGRGRRTREEDEEGGRRFLEGGSARARARARVIECERGSECARVRTRNGTSPLLFQIQKHFLFQIKVGFQKPFLFQIKVGCFI